MSGNPCFQSAEFLMCCISLLECEKYTGKWQRSTGKTINFNVNDSQKKKNRFEPQNGGSPPTIQKKKKRVELMAQTDARNLCGFQIGAQS
jgi:hypothetical protein